MEHDDGSSIVVKPTVELKSSKSDAAKYQRITVCAREIVSFRKNGEIIQVCNDIAERTKRSNNLLARGKDLRTAGVKQRVKIHSARLI